MSFGISIGDCIKIIELANHLRERLIDAPHQFQAVSYEIRSLSIILNDVKLVLPKRDFTDKQKEDFKAVTLGCTKVLEELEKKLDQYQELENQLGTTGSKNLDRRLRRQWKKVRWEPKDIQEIRTRVTENVTFLNAFSNRLVLNAVAQLHERQDDREQNEERQKILTWLSSIDPTDYPSQQSDLIRKRQEGTGEWLLKSEEFSEWIDQNRRTLYCPGIPGAGKTILSAIVIDYLDQNFGHKGDVCVAYIFCNYQPQREQDIEGLLSNLLRQFLHSYPTVPDHIKNLYKQYREKRNRPPLEKLSRCLLSMAQLYSRVYLVVDALDEYYISNNEGHDKLLAEIFGIQQRTHLNFFATSRSVSEVETKFAEGCLRKEIHARDEDVLRYIDGHIDKLLRGQLSKYLDVKRTVREQLLKAADGMFLLVWLHLDHLKSQPTIGHLKMALQKLPHGIKGLDESYEQALQRIESQDEGYSILAKKILMWVAYAKRVLSTVELQHVLAVIPGTKELNPDFIPSVATLGSVCAGLVVFDDNNGTVRLVHHTMQEYLMRAKIFPSAEKDITITCLTYMAYDCCAVGHCTVENQDLFKQRLLQFPLYGYAALYWGYHAQGAIMDQEWIFNQFTEEKTLLASTQALHVLSELGLTSLYSSAPQASSAWVFGVQLFISLWHRPFKWDITHLAAHFGLVGMLPTLHEKGISLNSQDHDGHAMLSVAIAQGKETMVNLLLQNTRVDTEMTDNEGNTPLILAARYGHGNIVRVLVEDGRFDIKLKNTCEWTALHEAVYERHEYIINLLLQAEKAETSVDYEQEPVPLLLVQTGGSWRGPSGLRYKWLFSNSGSKQTVADPKSRWVLLARPRDRIFSRPPVEGLGANVSSGNGLKVAVSTAAIDSGETNVGQSFLQTDEMNPHMWIEGRPMPLILQISKGYTRIIESLLEAKKIDVNQIFDVKLKATPAENSCS